jgi:hypothetical protein
MLAGALGRPCSTAKLPMGFVDGGVRDGVGGRGVVLAGPAKTASIADTSPFGAPRHQSSTRPDGHNESSSFNLAGTKGGNCGPCWDRLDHHPARQTRRMNSPAGAVSGQAASSRAPSTAPAGPRSPMGGNWRPDDFSEVLCPYPTERPYSAGLPGRCLIHLSHLSVVQPAKLRWALPHDRERAP